MNLKFKNWLMLLGALTLIFQEGCKCNEPIPIPPCPENMVRVNGECVCDDLSMQNGTNCEYIGIGITDTGGNHYALPISSSCNDWRDSLIFSFGTLDTFIKPNGQIGMDFGAYIAIKQKKPKHAGLIDLEPTAVYLGAKYDSIVYLLRTADFYGQRDNKHVHVYAKYNKTRDTMKMKICSTINFWALPGPYPNLDSCNVTFVKVK